MPQIYVKDISNTFPHPLDTIISKKKRILTRTVRTSKNAPRDTKVNTPYYEITYSLSKKRSALSYSQIIQNRVQYTAFAAITLGLIFAFGGRSYMYSLWNDTHAMVPQTKVIRVLKKHFDAQLRGKKTLEIDKDRSKVMFNAYGVHGEKGTYYGYSSRFEPLGKKSYVIRAHNKEKVLPPKPPKI